MTFDEQLQRSLGAASDQLRDRLALVLLAVGREVTAHENNAREGAVSDGCTRACDQAKCNAPVEIEQLEARPAEMSAASTSVQHHCAVDVPLYASDCQCFAIPPEVSDHSSFRTSGAGIPERSTLQAQVAM